MCGRYFYFKNDQESLANPSEYKFPFVTQSLLLHYRQQIALITAYCSVISVIHGE